MSQTIASSVFRALAYVSWELNGMCGTGAKRSDSRLIVRYL